MKERILKKLEERIENILNKNIEDISELEFYVLQYKLKELDEDDSQDEIKKCTTNIEKFING